jgi:hypothetical protein
MRNKAKMRAGIIDGFKFTIYYNKRCEKKEAENV